MQFTDEQKDIIESRLEQGLPHGSGINCDWCFTWFKNGKLKASNSFHCMNDAGYYVGYADFTLVFHPTKALTAFTLQFNGRQAQRKNKQYMLRDYLEDTIYEMLDGEQSIAGLAL